MRAQLKSSIYKVAEVFLDSKGVERNISGESLRLPLKVARFYPTDYEPETFRFLRATCRPGMTVLDIGGHLGLFAVTCARLVSPSGKVFTFEPTVRLRQVLQNVLLLNGVEKIVELREEAIAQNDGTAEFFDTGDEASNANSLVSTARGKSSTPVKVRSLDSLVADNTLRAVNVIKIDAEGAELGVLRGARNTLLHFKPSVYLSLHPRSIHAAGETLEQIWDEIRELQHYRVLLGGKELQKNEFCSKDDLFEVGLYP
jgi:FkbM family methyltransferase